MYGFKRASRTDMRKYGWFCNLLLLRSLGYRELTRGPQGYHYHMGSSTPLGAGLLILTRRVIMIFGERSIILFQIE